MVLSCLVFIHSSIHQSTIKTYLPTHRYFILGAERKGLLVHYKKQDKSGGILGTLDLATVLTITNIAGAGVIDTTRLNIETGEGTMKVYRRFSINPTQIQPLIHCNHQ